ncbi:metallophosphoesterase [Novosphingobium terrae]|uniref:metallophosphoesterase n=1 Tax=Novosphingobium terrae TaxID=2726189 RepID=UPI00197E5BB4|nr:metallophosphoesterase [Novosphingobium terrae]
MMTMIFALPWLYVVMRSLMPLPWPLGLRIAVALVLLIASRFHDLSRLSSGSRFNPEFPRVVVMLFNWLFGGLVLLMVFQIALDLAALIAMLAGIGGGSLWITARYAIGMAAFGLAAVGVWQAARVPRLREVTVAIPDLPDAFEGYRLVQLTDLHISRLFPASWTRAVVAATNRLGAELIVVTGDVIDGSVASRHAGVAPLRDLSARDGVWLSPGNHEYLSGYDAWMAHFASLGMGLLANAHTVIVRGERQLVLAGLTDRSARMADRPLPDLGKALAGAPADAPVILLDHEPGRARQAAASGVALQLSGHTHGGMILGLDRLVARANGGFVSGAYAVDGMTLYVNNGTGIWPGFALRLGKSSELTRITLRRG